jgi:hypothetical protein
MVVVLLIGLLILSTGILERRRIKSVEFSGIRVNGEYLYTDEDADGPTRIFRFLTLEGKAITGPPLTAYDPSFDYQQFPGHVEKVTIIYNAERPEDFIVLSTLLHYGNANFLLVLGSITTVIGLIGIFNLPVGDVIDKLDCYLYKNSCN